MSLFQITTLILSLAIFFTILKWISTYRLLRQYKNELQTTTKKLEIEIEKAQTLSNEMMEIKTQATDRLLYDDLTGLPNRDVFIDRMNQTISQSKRYQLSFGVLLLDIDSFRVVNDVMGHVAGDELLKEISLRLQTCVRQIDTLCRFMADTFIILLPQLTKPETAAYVARRILDAIAQPFKIEKEELYLSATIGIVTFPTDGEDVETLLRNSSNALRQAKSRARNSYLFYRDEMQELGRRELILSSDVRSESFFKQLALYYQPQINIMTQQVVCMEALLRWQHPNFGLISPLELLRLAEYCGKSMELGEWVLRQACQQFAKWKSVGFYPPCISINVSLRQLENPHFTYKLSQLLQQAQLEPASIILEISETSLTARFDLIEKTLHMLKHLGVQIAIDDFGTGSLSLTELRQFSMDYLKIDNSFVKDIATNKESETICKMIVGLANGLNIGIVAEGVETLEQKHLLRDIGCLVMQGHLFCRPELPEEFPRVLEDMKKSMMASH